MTGNDVVDMMLATAESNWKRKGFAEKIFTCREQNYINGSANPAAMAWQLWSMKESAYKLYCRQQVGRFFAPKKFSCTLLNDNQGLVIFEDFSCRTITTITINYVYSIARKDDPQKAAFINNCFYLPQTDYAAQQAFIKKKIIEQYVSAQGSSIDHTEILKDKNGIPSLISGNNVAVPISITHHGRFAAFTIN